MSAVTLRAVHASQVPQEQLAPPTGVAVIGCGYWGVNYVRVMGELADARVVALCDQRPDQLRAVGRHTPDALLLTDVDEVLALPEVEAVVIATVATSHFDIASRALRAGKHVLVEKPLTTESRTSVQLRALAEETGRVLLVGHTFLYNTAVRKVKEYVDQEHVYYLYARRTGLGPIRSDVNAVWDLAPHDISIFNYLLGMTPSWASAVGARLLPHDVEDLAFITLGYPGGVIGHVHASWADPHKVREVVVVCSGRRIVFDDLNPVERVRVFDKGVTLPVAVDDGVRGYAESALVLRDGDIFSPALPASEPLKNQSGHFLHCLRRGEAPFSDVESALSVVRTMEAVERSLRADGAPIPVAEV